MFKCEIRTGGAAYRDLEDDTKLDIHEIRRNLNEIIAKLECGNRNGFIIDINGNKVGSWSVDD